MYPHHKQQWRELATAQFPHGSYGNGSAMRVAPVGLAYFDDPEKVATVAIESSRPTHSHPLAYQGAVLLAVAVATALGQDKHVPQEFLATLRRSLRRFSDLMQDTSPFTSALDAIEQGLGRGASCAEMSQTLGTGITAVEAVPMAIYCFMRNCESFADVIYQAVFIGGDTDTIGSMAGALAGAALGKSAIPLRWLNAVREERYTPAEIEQLADRLFRTTGA
jgi:poly(ADP-ribose) glycohydrolase ARH3